MRAIGIDQIISAVKIVEMQHTGGELARASDFFGRVGRVQRENFGRV
jgi:hypothetical protein